MNADAARPADLSIEISEVAAGSRSNERTIEIVVRNTSNSELDGLKLSKGLPKGSKVRFSEDESLTKYYEEYGTLCRRLSVTLNDEFFFRSEALRKERKEMVRELVHDAIGSEKKGLEGLIRSFVRLLGSPLIAYGVYRGFEERFRCSEIAVEDYDQAQAFAAELEESQPLRTQVRFQLDQLRKLEDKVAANGLASTSLRPGEVYKELFTVAFPKGIFERRQYAVFAIASYRNHEQEGRAQETVAVEIAPNTLMLLLVASGMGALGGMIRVLGDESATSIAEKLNHWPSVLIGAVLGFAVFSFYDLIKMGDLRVIKANWQSAVLVGLLSGFFSENVLRSLKALVS